MDLERTKSVAADQVKSRLSAGQNLEKATSRAVADLERTTPEGPGGGHGPELLQPFAVLLAMLVGLGILEGALLWVTDAMTAIAAILIASPFLFVGMMPMIAALSFRKKERLVVRAAVNEVREELA